MLTSSWYTARRLQTQLLLWTTVIVIVSVVATMEIRIRSNVRLLEGNLGDRSERMLRSLRPVVEAVTASNAGSTRLASLEPKLRERVAADRTLIRLDVVQRHGNDVKIAASSSNTPDVLVQSFSKAPVKRYGRSPNSPLW